MEILLEILVTCDNGMLEEYNSNNINFTDDINDIIAKKEKEGEVKEIGFIDFIFKCTKNYNFVKNFVEIDEYLLKLELTINNLDRIDMEK